MTRRLNLAYATPLLVIVAMFAAIGCGATDEGKKDDEEKKTSNKEPAGDHSGWWCPEHGIPEEVCTRCNSTLIAEFQEKGDWCEEHSRPNSNCFHCNPKLQGEWAARYEAKYGEQPPEITDP